MPLVLRSVKGAALSHTEMDGNWLYLLGLIEAITTKAIIETVTGTGHTFLLENAEKYHRFTATGGTKTITVPLNATAAFPWSAEGQTTTLVGINVGAPLLNIVGAGAVVINHKATLIPTVAQWGSFVLTKVGTNEWDLAGDLESAP